MDALVIARETPAAQGRSGYILLNLQLKLHGFGKKMAIGNEILKKWSGKWDLTSPSSELSLLLFIYAPSLEP
jgi:hypothetical protein